MLLKGGVFKTTRCYPHLSILLSLLSTLARRQHGTYIDAYRHTDRHIYIDVAIGIHIYSPPPPPPPESTTVAVANAIATRFQSPAA